MTADTVDDDPHQELGVDVGASLQDIKKAYRRLAAKWHPDRNADPQAVWRMKRINQAYQRLCDWLESGEPLAPRASSESSPGSTTEAPTAEPPAQAAEPPPKARSQARAKRAWWERNWGFAKWEPDGQVLPQVVQAEAWIPLESAASGCTHTLKGWLTDLCSDCQGVGRLIAPKSHCSQCEGEGQVPASRAGTWVRCDHCGGDGNDRKACDACGGTGHAGQPRAYHFEVRIPAGLPDGQVVLLRGQGQRCGTQASDIAVTVRIQPHPLFQWNAQQELCCTVPVDLFTALAGGIAEVPTLDGHRAQVSLADGLEQTLQGLGFPRRQGQPGPLHVRFETVTPRAWSPAQRELLAQLADTVRADPDSCPELAAWQRQLRARS